MTIFDARKGCRLAGRRVVFDTNVWISLEGFDPRPDESEMYSTFFNEIRNSDNVIVVTDYILGEFFNRCCKIEYEMRRKSFEETAQNGEKFSHYKKYRKSSEFKDYMETMIDVCETIVADGEYEAVNGAQVDIGDVISEAASGLIDFSDIMLREHCRDKGYVIVSHDADFANCGLDFVTANPRILSAAR
ncbi:hypothetical protein [Mesorhizobium sp. B4-1-4]|uniref:hypothetical protein n=1 Tax=Mesorhizobium sp. B4-1-4 TaxID=2589888 RepID=UPI00112DE9AE|nr:hypothetical protein [Mesorhizobium sp. B4-1-4]UCI29448.1 hypothetical protein FJW03_16450 [Mesorhizobium sp. B4-1-4]